MAERARRFGLLGRTLGHSYSPQIHAALGAYPYGLYEVEPGDLEAFVRGGGLCGFNVTIPYKEAVLPFLDRLSPAARRIGSVNTVLRHPNGTLTGYNTDYEGFAHLLAATGFEAGGRKAAVLGGGGAGKTACAVLRDAGMAEIVTVSRTGPCTYADEALYADADLIVNATPVGMYPDTDAAPVDLTRFTACAQVIDLIYNPARTRLLLCARRLSIPGANGLAMLVAQAKRAAELFTGAPIPHARVTQITRALSGRMQNIVLLGMPGCGKTAIGRALAGQTGRPFVDIDAQIEERLGMSIADYFAAQGETAFRRIETEALRAACRESGCIVAAGGGVVTQPKNEDIIRQNGVPVYITRPLDALATKGRPLSERDGVAALYEKRRHLYAAFADHTVANKGIEETAAIILKEVMGCTSLSSTGPI